jgi:DNA-binding transcriptional regulator YdaS (Cro superfamily)
MTGFVYAIGGDDGVVKIGWSADPFRRLTKIKTDCSSAVRLIGLIPATLRQEEEIKQLLEPWRVPGKGEWFYRGAIPVDAFVASLPRPGPRAVPVRWRSDPNAHPIRQYRARNKVPLCVLAAQIGVTHATLSRIETGKKKLRPVLLPKITAITGIPARELRPDLADLLS